MLLIFVDSTIESYIGGLLANPRYTYYMIRYTYCSVPQPFMSLRTVLKLPVHQDGAVWLHSGPMGAILLPPEFHHLLAEDAAKRGEMDKATAHEVLATAVGADDAAVMVAPELFPGTGVGSAGWSRGDIGSMRGIAESSMEDSSKSWRIKWE